MNDISSGEFFNNDVLVKAVKDTVANEGAVHILGLLSDGGVHAHIDHIKATARLAVEQGASQVFVHAFLDGRDTPPKSADGYVADLEQYLATLSQEFDAKPKSQAVSDAFLPWTETSGGIGWSRRTT